MNEETFIEGENNYKFNVGEKVRIKRNFTELSDDVGVGITEEMKGLAGATIIIGGCALCHEKNIYYCNNYSWNENWLEKIDEEEEKESSEEYLSSNNSFYVGEKVRICDDVRNTSRIGIDPKMCEFEGKIVTIKEFRGMSSIAHIEEGSGEWNWDSRCFIKLEKEPEQEPEKIKIVLEADTPTDEEIEHMISLVDLKTFVAIINNRIECDYNGEKIDEEKAKKYLKNWAKAKYRFFKMFGGNLCIKTEIEEEKNENWYHNKINTVKHKFPLYSGFLNDISSRDIKENCMTTNSASILFEDERIKKDMKFTRVVALFKNNDLNMEISKLYQDKSMKSIKVSINPCDYLTVSINKHDWRSCHNFFNGEWRNAGLTLMFDKTSMVSYTASEEINYSEYKYPFTWNNKNWRQMVYISEDNSSMIFSLQYPNSSDLISKAVRDLVEKTYSSYLDIPDKWKVSSDIDSIGISVRCSNLMYNDAERYGCKYIINKYDENKQTTIRTGGSVKHIHGTSNINEAGDDIW